MLVVDIETTSTNPYKGGIIEIGAIDFDDSSRTFHSYIQVPQSADISPGALEVNGALMEEIFDPNRPYEGDVIREFLFWLRASKGDLTIAGINPTFDRDFLDKAFQRHEYFSPLTYRVVDLHSMVYEAYRRHGWTIPRNDQGASTLSSDWIMAYCGLPPEPKPHRAMTGAWYETEALHRIFYGEYRYPEFASYLVPNYLIKKEPF